MIEQLTNPSHPNNKCVPRKPFICPPSRRQYTKALVQIKLLQDTEQYKRPQTIKRRKNKPAQEHRAEVGFSWSSVPFFCSLSPVPLNKGSLLSGSNISWALSEFHLVFFLSFPHPVQIKQKPTGTTCEERRNKCRILSFLSFLPPSFSLFLGQKFWAKDKRCCWVSIIPGAESLKRWLLLGYSKPSRCFTKCNKNVSSTTASSASPKAQGATEDPHSTTCAKKLSKILVQISSPKESQEERLSHHRDWALP